MSKRKKTKRDKAALYARRTLQDKRVHDHVADAATALRKAYGRASRRGGAQAVEDKKLYDHVRGAAGSLRAALGIVSRPEPQPKRRGRKLVAIVVLVGTAGFVAKRRASSGATEARDYSDRPSEPVEPARAAQPA